MDREAYMDTRIAPMESKGVMEQIREHLTQGKTAAEVIAMGYKPPTVWKVRRQMRRGRRGGRASSQGRAALEVHEGRTPHRPAGPEQNGRRDAVLGRLQQQVAALRDALFCLVSEGRVPSIFLPCSECGSSQWEYYEVGNPAVGYVVQGHRCAHCKSGFDLGTGQVEPKGRYHVDFSAPLVGAIGSDR